MLPSDALWLSLVFAGAWVYFRANVRELVAGVTCLLERTGDKADDRLEDLYRRLGEDARLADKHHFRTQRQLDEVLDLLDATPYHAPCGYHSRGGP
jgi:hypothetical protein